MENTKVITPGESQPVRREPVPLSQVILAGMILLSCALCWTRDPYWPALAVAVAALGGIIVCLSIIMHLVGKDNAVTRQFCATDGKFNCDKVLDRGKLWKDVTLADLGLIYFCMQFLFCVWVQPWAGRPGRWSCSLFPPPPPVS